MRRGAIYRVLKPKQGDPKRYRFYVVVSRQDLLDTSYATVVCAPIYTDGRGLSTQVSLGKAQGLKHDSWICCDNLRSIDRSELKDFVAMLPPDTVKELNTALAIALDLEQVADNSDWTL
jgi:mRNA interferase MazF